MDLCETCRPWISAGECAKRQQQKKLDRVGGGVNAEPLVFRRLSRKSGGGLQALRHDLDHTCLHQLFTAAGSDGKPENILPRIHLGDGDFD